jgi:cell division protein FtsL
MTTEEILLTVLTVAIVVLIIVVVLVLVFVLQILKRFKKIAAEVEHITERGRDAAERIAPLSAATVGVLQVARTLMKKRK